MPSSRDKNVPDLQSRVFSLAFKERKLWTARSNYRQITLARRNKLAGQEVTK